MANPYSTITVPVDTDDPSDFPPIYGAAPLAPDGVMDIADSIIGSRAPVAYSAALQAFTTDPNIGSEGVNNQVVFKLFDTLIMWIGVIKWRGTGTTAGSGFYHIVLPEPVLGGISVNGAQGIGQTVGYCRVNDASSTGNDFPGTVYLSDTDGGSIRFVADKAIGNSRALTGEAGVTGSPEDYITWNVWYPYDASL